MHKVIRYLSIGVHELRLEPDLGDPMRRGETMHARSRVETGLSGQKVPHPSTHSRRNEMMTQGCSGVLFQAGTSPTQQLHPQHDRHHSGCLNSRHTRQTTPVVHPTLCISTSPSPQSSTPGVPAHNPVSRRFPHTVKRGNPPIGSTRRSISVHFTSPSIQLFPMRRPVSQASLHREC